MNKALLEMQKEICKKYGADYLPCPLDSKLGVANDLKAQIFPINGLRHPPDRKTNGWYLWVGETLSSDPGFFNPIHTSHLSNWKPELQKFLGLAPGWRFLLANGYEDVWFDKNLLDI